jgi:16S rRNA (guanine527-N7)-methyltransferase
MDATSFKATHAGNMQPVLPKNLHPKLKAFLVLLDRWNRTHALTALPVSERWEELVLDAAALLPFLEDLPQKAKVVDFGTGMGSPAVVLALARPDLEIVGLDASAKKIAFLRQATLELGIPNLKAVQGRAEQLDSFGAHLGVAKAVGPLPVLVGWWSRHGQSGASFLALKGPDWKAEPQPEAWTVEDHPYTLPTRGERTLLKLSPQKFI